MMIGNYNVPVSENPAYDIHVAAANIGKDDQACLNRFQAF
jgi:hypothetical protein